jgi:hypothetical protein
VEASLDIVSHVGIGCPSGVCWDMRVTKNQHGRRSVLRRRVARERPRANRWQVAMCDDVMILRKKTLSTSSGYAATPQAPTGAGHNEGYQWSRP